MSQKTETILRNIVYILLLELVAFPFGVFLWLWRGWHLFHIVLAFGYIYGVVLIVDTANLLLKHVRIVNDNEVQRSQDESFYD